MHQSVGGGGGFESESQLFAQCQAVCQLSLPKCCAGFDGFEGHHSDGDATVAHLSGTQKSVATVKHLHPIANVYFFNFLDRTREHPRMFSKETDFFSGL